MSEEPPREPKVKPVQSPSNIRLTMGMQRVSSRPEGRPAPKLLYIVTVLVLGFAVAVAVLPAHRGKPVDAFPPLADGEAAVLFLGDVLLGNNAAETLAEEGYDYPFEQLAPLIESADAAAVVINHEGPITGRTEKEGTNAQWSYGADPASAAALARAGVTHASLANNHVLDRGVEGLADTRRHLDEAGIVAFGAGAHRAEALRPAVIEAGDTTVAVVGAMQRWKKYREAGWGATAREGGVAYLDQPTLPDLFPPRGVDADVVVAFVHWGDEYEPASDRMRTTAGKLVEAGVDVIVGHHAHLTQTVALLDGRPALFGLGNAAFGSRGRFEGDDGVGLVARVVLAGGEVRRIELVPVRTDNRKVDYQTRVLGLRDARDVYRALEDAGDIELGEVDGVAVLQVPTR